MSQVLEIRTYTLHPGTAGQFDRLFHEQALPLLHAAGTDVVSARASLHDPESYVLMRAYPSLAARETMQDQFYGSAAWREGPREAILACIAHFTSVVIEADAVLLASLRRA
ncbi:MAG: NIPSNAP family protein [Massilia sp.]